MSTTAAALTSATAVLLGLTAAVHLIRRARAHEAAKDAGSARPQPRHTPPGPDSWPCQNTAALAECQRIWALPAYGETSADHTTTEGDTQ